MVVDRGIYSNELFSLVAADAGLHLITWERGYTFKRKPAPAVLRRAEPPHTLLQGDIVKRAAENIVRLSLLIELPTFTLSVLPMAVVMELPLSEPTRSRLPLLT